MNKFQIKNQKDFEDCLMWVSDLYKEVYGIRPRGYNFHSYTFKELETYVNKLLYISQEQEDHQNSIEEKAIEDVMSLGVDKYGWEAKHSKDYRGPIDLW